MPDQFAPVLRLLLAGEFICRVSHPDEYRFLEREDDRVAVDNYLAKIDRRLAQTAHHSGYYLAFTRCGEEEGDAIRKHFAEIKATLAPVVMFFRLLMRVTGQEDILLPEATIESSALMAQIDRDPGLRNELQTVANSFKASAVDAAHRSMFETVLRRLRDGGYLRLVNTERGVYQVTAKIEYLLEVVRFLQDNDETLKGVADDDDAEGDTPRLL
jgi:hypothetical protein